MKIALFIAMLMLMPSSAFAQRDLTSGNYWAQMCLEPPGTPGASTCIGYLRDTVRTHAAFIRDGTMKPYYCIPSQVPDMQIKTAVVTFLAENPQYRNEDFAEIVTVALARNFPCPQRK